MACLTSMTLTFLNALKANNDREWFNAHKDDYEKSHIEMICFTERVMEFMETRDVLVPVSGKKSLQRIYRDIRFSNDKTPYKVYWAGGLKRSGVQRRGGYGFHIEPGNSYIAGGFFGPNKEDLLHLRNHIAADDSPLRAVLKDRSFLTFFGALQGEQLKTSPNGFDNDHPAVDLLRYKQFIVRHDFSDKEVLAVDFEEQVATGFAHMIPFFDVMTTYLTTDLNGVSIL